MKNIFYAVLGIAIAATLSLALFKKNEAPKGFERGESFAYENQLKSAEECSLANTEFPDLPNVSSDFIKGCEGYFAQSRQSTYQ